MNFSFMWYNMYFKLRNKDALPEYLIYNIVKFIQI